MKNLTQLKHFFERESYSFNEAKGEILEFLNENYKELIKDLRGRAINAIVWFIMSKLDKDSCAYSIAKDISIKRYIEVVRLLYKQRVNFDTTGVWGISFDEIIQLIKMDIRDYEIKKISVMLRNIRFDSVKVDMILSALRNDAFKEYFDMYLLMSINKINREEAIKIIKNNELIKNIYKYAQEKNLIKKDEDRPYIEYFKHLHYDVAKAFFYEEDVLARHGMFILIERFLKLLC